jgi:hypothetical protein
MKRKNRKVERKRRNRNKKQTSAARLRKNRRKQRRLRPRRPFPARRRQTIADPRIARALGYMRRERISASEAARRERMKLATFRKRAGRFLFRSGPGKPWKARKEDQLRFSMTVLTNQGPTDVIVRSSQERKLLHDYNLALQAFRAGGDGAEIALKRFEGKTVGGQTLITDSKLLIVLEEADKIEADSFYTAIGARS